MATIKKLKDKNGVEIYPKTSSTAVFDLDKNKSQSVLNEEIYTQLDLKQDITDNLLETDAKTIVGSINELNTNIATETQEREDALNLKQNITDNTFETTAKTVVGAINELDTEKSNKPIETTITLDTPVWTNQPTISGFLDASFLLWNADYYYITLKDTSGVALTAGQFKLTTTFGGFATAINQIFTLTGLDTGNSGRLVENMNVDFKEIGATWKLRTAGVPEISLVSNPVLNHLYTFECDLKCLGVTSAYTQNDIFKPTLQRIGGDGKYYNMGYYNRYTSWADILMQLNNIEMTGVANTAKYKRFNIDYSVTYSAKEIKVKANGVLSAEVVNTTPTASSILYGGVRTDGEDLTALTNLVLKSAYYGNAGRMFRNGSEIIIKEYV